MRLAFVLLPLSLLVLSVENTFAGPPAAPQLAQAAATIPASLKAEYDAAFEAMLKNPANLDITFHFADVAFRAGDYEGAVGALERMLLFNPDLPRVKLELGVLYFRMGSYEAARSYFEGALASNPPSEVRQRVTGYLAEIDQRASSSHFSGNLLAGMRYQSNANAGPVGAGVRVFGFNATLDQQFQKKADVNGFIAGTITHTYDLGSDSGDLLESNFSFYGARQIEISRLDVSLLEIDTGPRFNLSGSGSDALSVRPYLLANVVGLGDRLYYHTYGGGGSLRSALGWGLLGETGFEIREREFNNSNLYPNVTGKDGPEYELTLSVHYPWTEADLLSAGFAAARNDANLGSESYREFRLTASYAHAFAAPVGSAGPWIAVLSAGHVWRNYDDADVTVDPSTVRRDREWLVSLGLTVPIVGRWSATVQVAQDWEASNLPNFRYNNTSVLLGVGYRF